MIFPSVVNHNRSSSLGPLTSVNPHAQLLSTQVLRVASPQIFSSDLMVVMEGLCPSFKNGHLFRSTSSEPRQRLPNRHGNEKEAIYRTDSITPAFDWPQQLAPSFSGDTKTIGLGVGPAYTHSHDSRSQISFPSSLSASRASIILPSEQLSRPERRDIALSVSGIGRTVLSKHISHPHSLRALGGAESLDNLVTRSPVMAMPHETSSGSILESRRTEVMTALWSQKVEPVDSRCKCTPASSSTTPQNLNRDSSTSSPPFVSTVPSTKETTYPPAKLTTPITTNIAARTNPFELLDEASLIPPHLPLAIGPQVPRFFNVRRKPPPSYLASSLPASIIAGQSASRTCGGSTSPQCIASSSLEYKGISTPPLPSPSMDRKVKPFLGDETYPLSSSEPKSVVSTSSHLTMIGPTPRSPSPDLPSPPITRTSRLSMKRLLPKPTSSSPPIIRKLVKRSRSPEPATPITGHKCESGRSFDDQIGSSDGPGSRINSGHPVNAGPSILSVFSKVLRSSDVVLSREHRSSILTNDIQQPQPDVQTSLLVSTSSHGRSSVCENGETAREEKGSSQPFERIRKASKIKGEETDNTPTKRRRNVLRKRSHPCMIAVSQSTSTLGSSPSPSHCDGYQINTRLSREHEEPAHRSRQLHDIDRIPINKPQSVSVLTSELEIPHGFALEFPEKRQQGAADNMGSLTPGALIAMESKAKITEGSDESHVLSDPLWEGKRDGPPCDDIKNRSLLRSASMSEVLLSNPGSVNRQVQNTETICHEREKTMDRTRLRARQSLNLSIAKNSSDLGEEKPHKGAMVSSKAGGSKLWKLMRKFSLSGSGNKHGEHPPPLPAWAISAPMAFPSVMTELCDGQSLSLEARGRTSLGSSRLAISNPEISSARQVATKSSPDEIPPLPDLLVSVPLDLHIVNPSVLDQTCGEEDRSQPSIPLQTILPTSSFPKMPPEGEWIRSNSPDLELAALPPPRRTPKLSTGPPQSGVGADSTFPYHEPQISSATFLPRSDSLNLRQSHFIANTSLAMDSADLPSDIPNLSSCGSFIPSISVSPPPHRPLANPQRPDRKRLFNGDSRPRLDPLLRKTTNNTPPHRRTEARNTLSNIVQPMPSMHKSAEEMDPDSNTYLTFTRSSLNATPSVVFRPGTGNTFGSSETNIRPNTSDSVQCAISSST